MERGECVTPRFTVAREIKVGLCWQCCLRCMKCGYTSKMYKLYHEVETGKQGRKPAAPNIGLQVGLQECTTGIVMSRVIFASMNLPSPCISAMQKTANKVGDTTSTMTLADLAKKREDVKRINRLRGLPGDAPFCTLGASLRRRGVNVQHVQAMQTVRQPCQPMNLCPSIRQGQEIHR